MKTIAALLFTAVSLVGCVADDDREVDSIDKGATHGPLDTVLDGAVKEWAQQVIRGPRGVDGIGDKLAGRTDQLGGRDPVNYLDERLQEIIKGQRPVDELDNRLEEILHGQRHTESIDERLQPGDRLEDIINGERHVEDLDDRVQNLVRPRPIESAGEHAIEWAEELLVGGRSYTLIHDSRGYHELLDGDGNRLGIQGPIRGELPARR